MATAAGSAGMEDSSRMLKSLSHRRSQIRKRLAEKSDDNTPGRNTHRNNGLDGCHGWHNSLHPHFQVIPFESNIDCKKVVVIGAGAAGLAAAACLKQAGIEVMVLEARERLGGRIHTDCDHFGYPIDLGATIITGIGSTDDRPSDALGPMCKYLDIPIHTLDNCALPLYNSLTGHKFPKSIDKESTMLFDRILDEAAEYQRSVLPSRVRNVALGDIFNKLFETHFEDVASKLEIQSRLTKSPTKGTDTENASLNPNRTKAKTTFRGRGRRGRGILHRTPASYDFTPTAQPLEGVQLSPMHKEMVIWHQAHLEYGCGADLADVSLSTWNQDEIYGGFSGSHAVVKNGVGKVVEHLAAGLNIQYDQVVKELEYGEGGVKITTVKGDKYSAGLVILTVPLGVLKDSAVVFQPSLPAWKTEAIETLGFGNMNKVVLQFESVFWDTQVDYFGVSPGCTALDYRNRGFCTLWWSGFRSTGKAMLTGIISGSLSTEIEDLTDEEIVERSVKRLTSIFGEELPELVNYKVTRWGKDPYSRGCYTYLPRGASGYHYDILGQPVLGMGFGLLFGGEHTVKEHPDTVGGAFISGVRESQRVMSLLGLPPLVGKSVPSAYEHEWQSVKEEETEEEIKEQSSADKIREDLTSILILEAERARRL